MNKFITSLSMLLRPCADRCEFLNAITVKNYQERLSEFLRSPNSACRSLFGLYRYRGWSHFAAPCAAWIVKCTLFVRIPGNIETRMCGKLAMRTCGNANANIRQGVRTRSRCLLPTKAPAVETLHQLRQCDIRHQYNSKPWEISP